MNALLPPDIRILEVFPVSPDFHARYSAFSKIYHYHLHLETPSDPFTRPYRHLVRGFCDLNLIRKAIPYLVGTHDFTSLANHANKGSAANGAIRTVYRLDLIEQKGGVRLEFEANGFLYKMVRNMTGLLLSVGANRISPEEVPKIIEAKTRQSPFKPAPAQGLFLHQVRYTERD
jgi:tRNA pseudouridine38-40 synthase